MFRNKITNEVTMDEVFAANSAEEKIRYYKRFLIISRVAEIYKDDRHMLKQLVKQLKREKQHLARSRFPMSDPDKRDVSLSVTELSDIIKRLMGIAKIETYKIAEHSLKSYMENLESAVNPPEDKTAARRVIEQAVDATRVLGAKIEQGVEKIKKTIQDRNSE